MDVPLPHREMSLDRVCIRVEYFWEYFRVCNKRENKYWSKMMDSWEKGKMVQSEGIRGSD